MTKILAPIEARNRGRWCTNRAEIGTWKLDTLATFRGNAKFDEDEGVEETEEALLLRQLVEGISEKFRIHPSDLFTPIGEVFKRSMTTLESGFRNYNETQEHRNKSKETGELGSGSVRSSGGVGEGGQATNLVRPYEQTLKSLF